MLILKHVGERCRKAIVFCLLLTGSVAAQQANISNAGSVAAPFLTVSLDPRGTAMGQAGMARANGIQAAIWNPAALAENRHSFFIAHARWLGEIAIDQAGLNFSMGTFGNIGVYLTTLNYGEMKVRTVNRPEGTGEQFDATDFSLAMYYARDLTDRFKLGVGVKYIQQRIWHSSANSIAFDIGTLFHSPIWDIDFGVNISNFGGDLQLAGRDARVYHDIDPVQTGNNDRIPAQLELDAWPLPLLMRAGIQRTFKMAGVQAFTTAIDVLYPQDNYPYLNAGIEYAYWKMFYIRAGYRGLLLQDNQGGLSAGFGYDYREGPMTWSVGVAYSDYGILNNITILALSLKWR